ncbi:MAG TPA: hypothetical protein ENJ08_03840 [Gammaproteobacteria bacterium]|nr:hypothetical protein [Gammaproteobacteria bacterium]
MKFKAGIFVLIIVLPLMACDQKQKTGENNPLEKIGIIKKIIEKNTPVPSNIIDVNYAEYRRGDDRLGPSDYFFFLRIEVRKEDAVKWLQGIDELPAKSKGYTDTQTNNSWWIKKSRFQQLKKYETRTYFNNTNGWMCVDKEKGYVYVYTYAM